MESLKMQAKNILWPHKHQICKAETSVKLLLRLYISIVKYKESFPDDTTESSCHNASLISSSTRKKGLNK